MTHRFRKTLFWIFFIIFLVMTTGISLYATGYRLNFSDNISLQRTGMLMIASDPKGAKIELKNLSREKYSQQLNKKLANITTPAKVKNLLPGDYEATFQLDGYWPIIKKINIKPGEASYLEDITLFKNNLPLKIMSLDFQEMELSQDEEHLILKGDKKIISLKTEQEENIALSEEQATSSPEEAKLIEKEQIKEYDKSNAQEIFYTNGLEIYKLNIQNGEKTLIARLSQKIEKVIWHQDGYLIYSTPSEINIINLKDWRDITRLINLEKISPPIMNKAGDTLYFIAQIGGQSGLYKLAIK